MSKTFRDWEPDQVWVLPPSLPGSWFRQVTWRISCATRCAAAWDLGMILESYSEERGFPPLQITRG